MVAWSDKVNVDVPRGPVGGRGVFFPYVGSGCLFFPKEGSTQGGSSSKHNVLHARARFFNNVGTLHARARFWNLNVRTLHARARFDKRDVSTLHARAPSLESKCGDAPQGHDLRSKM